MATKDVVKQRSISPSRIVWQMAQILAAEKNVRRNGKSNVTGLIELLITEEWNKNHENLPSVN